MSDRLVTLPQRALIGLVRGYRLLLSPWVGNACRFWPTCSAYSLEALERHGASAGAYLTLHRLARCHPFCSGGHDPVPGQAPALFRHFSAGASAAASAPSSSNPTPEPRP